MTLHEILMSPMCVKQQQPQPQRLINTGESRLPVVKDLRQTWAVWALSSYNQTSWKVKKMKIINLLAFVSAEVFVLWEILWPSPRYQTWKCLYNVWQKQNVWQNGCAGCNCLEIYSPNLATLEHQGFWQLLSKCWLKPDTQTKSGNLPGKFKKKKKIKERKKEMEPVGGRKSMLPEQCCHLISLCEIRP